MSLSAATATSRMSITGFAASPGTAVLRMCSMARAYGPNAAETLALINSNCAGQSGSYSTITIGDSIGKFRIPAVWKLTASSDSN